MGMFYSLYIFIMNTFSIIYYFDFNWSSDCETEILETNLTFEEAKGKQVEYAEYFFENTLKEQWYTIKDAYSAYRIA